MRKNMEAEIKVGLFITVGLGLTMLAILLLSGPKTFFSRNIHYKAHFPRVEGLITGAKVILHGVAVGSVENIELDRASRQIQVRFSVSKPASEWLREGSAVEIATQGVLGDKFLSLEAGPENKPLLPPDSDIPNRPTANLTQFLGQGDRLMTSLNEIATHLDRVLRVFEADNRNEIFFKGIAATAAQLSQITEKLNKGLDPTQLKNTLVQISSITEKMNNGTGTLGALINDPGLYDNLNALLGGANRNRVIRNLVRQTVKEAK